MSASPRKSPSPKKQKVGSDCLSQLSVHSQVVADTGDFAKISEFQADDATTNPSLIYDYVSKHPEFLTNILSSKKYSKADVDEIIDELTVRIACDILKVVPGLVSVEVDASLSFSTEKSVAKAEKLLAMFTSKLIPRNRVLIKLATTWEGVNACKILERKGVRCNMTLVFSLVQAIACAQAGAYLISPFVGRILDWHVKSGTYTGNEEDPGVLSVKEIFSYFKKFHFKTVVMGASFRNIQEILDLSGCDKLTIAPKYLDELRSKEMLVDKKLSVEIARASDASEWPELNEESFRWRLNEDACGTEKLAEGIRNFNKDFKKLKALVLEKLP
jgi:transaldolase